MSKPGDWADGFRLDIQFGYVGAEFDGPRHHNPKVVLNREGSTVEHALLEELDRSSDFTFSVAFISPGAVAQLKQHLLEHNGTGRIITSDFLGFNSPRAFAELLNLRQHTGIDVRRHRAAGFHPKGYVFKQHRTVTAVIGSSNLTSSALSRNHEWNLKVSAADGSDLASQLLELVDEQISESEPLTTEWVEAYAATYLAPVRPRLQTVPVDPDEPLDVEPNQMQRDALLALELARSGGARKAVIISATGTGKTMLSALDVRAFDPGRLLFLVHREQILDRTLKEYRNVLGGASTDYGKLTGTHKQQDRRYVFATIQTLSQQGSLSSLAPDSFDYVVIDEAHRCGGPSYQRVIDYLEPRFLLGMTATPERTDGFNVFERFDYVVPYEIRLHHALEADMLSPFHYYGVADITYADGTTTTDSTEVGLLISPDRITHLIKALETYGQAGVAPRGLIFCSRKEEARALSSALNQEHFRGKPLRTVALTGDDSIEQREARVADLESGELDYILTVDIFNEGVDIPSVNQVVMLRQTQSAIVFVQQLGRGLRRAEGKDHLVVIDVIGNYANNFMIPIALFGDESLNRESLRERLNETVEAGALPGLSSVSFDEVSRDRVLHAITNSTLDSIANLKSALVAMQNRVGDVPALWDFYRFESVDPVLLATKREHYPALVKALLRVEHGLSAVAERSLALLSREVLAAKRLHEFALLDLLLERQSVSRSAIASSFRERGLPSDDLHVTMALDTFTLTGYAQGDEARYAEGIAEVVGESVRLSTTFTKEMALSTSFKAAVEDLVRTGEALTRERYLPEVPFTAGMQYSRRDAARLLGWARSNASTIYGYKTDEQLGVCAAFSTLQKASDVEASTAYEDALLDVSTMRWFSKNNRTRQSQDIRPIIEGRVTLHVFVKKDDAEGSDHYYLGTASVQEAVETSMPDAVGNPLPVVAMTLHFDKPIKQGLFDYFHGSPSGS
jgi:superfamily II DNA or RNA helicase/HKD family nuclease